MNKRNVYILLALVTLLAAIGFTLYLIQQQQDVRSRAQQSEFLEEEDSFALDVSPTGSSCQTPATPSDVRIVYPLTQNGEYDFNSASCSWTAVTGAVSYNVKVTEVDSGQVKKSESASATTTKITFPVTSGKTYQCDVSAVNSCGTAGNKGSHTLLCEVGGVFTTPSPTTRPQTTPLPTTPQPTTLQPTVFPSPTTVVIQPSPTLPPTGDMATTIIMGVGGIALVILGGLFFVL